MYVHGDEEVAIDKTILVSGGTIIPLSDDFHIDDTG